MAIKKIKPLSPEISIGRTVGDNAVARIGHINNLVDQINNDFAGSEMLEAFTLLGSKFASTSLGVHTPSNISATGTALTSGTAIFSANYVPKDSTITGVYWYQMTQGVVTVPGTNYNGVALYSYNPLTGGLSVVASSTSDTTTTTAIGWKQAVGWAKTPFSAPVTIPAGVYFIGAFYNVTTATTAPQVGTQTTVASLVNNMDFTNSAKILSTATFTTLPATQLMSGTTVATAQTGFWLYS
jgi:hypothetical protein